MCGTGTWSACCTTPKQKIPKSAVAAQADGCWFPQRVDAGINFHFKVVGPGDYQVGQLGPWYLYWPMEAHFQVPAPTGYPYWPSQMSLPGMTPAALPNYGAPVQGPGLTPAGYYPPAYGYPH